MDEESLNPRNREWPDSDPEYGQVLEEQFFECDSGPKRVALVRQDGEHFLAFQRRYVDGGKVRFGNQAWFKLDDGTAGVALQLAHRMVYEMLQERLGSGNGHRDG